MRADMRLNVLHDRNPLTVTLKDGSVRNAYTIRISNMKAATRRFTLEIAGAAGAQIDLVGETADTQGHLIVEVGVDQTREARVLVTMRGAHAADTPLALTFTAREIGGGASISAKDVFLWR
jgi:polyferredoxin